MLIISKINMGTRLTLLGMVIVTCVGPSTAPDLNYGVPDSGVPWRHYNREERGQIGWEVPKDPETLLQQLEDIDRRDKAMLGTSMNYCSQPGLFQVEHKMCSQQSLRDEGTGQEFFDASDDLPPWKMVDGTNAFCSRNQQFKRMIGFPWSKFWNGKPPGASKIKEHNCRTSTSPTRRPYSQLSTTDEPSSTLCQKRTSPFDPVTPMPTAPSRTSSAPYPSTTQSPLPSSREQPIKCGKKSRRPILSAKKAKILLEIITDTKQHALLTLDILNHVENEVLSHSPGNCPLQHIEHGANKGQQELKKMPKNMQQKISDSRPISPGNPDANKRKHEPNKMPDNSPISPPWTYSQEYSCGLQPASHTNNSSIREEQLMRQEHPLFADPKDNWCPAYMKQAASRVENSLDDELHRMRQNKNIYKKPQYYGQEHQPRTKKVPPDMVANLC